MPGILRRLKRYIAKVGVGVIVLTLLSVVADLFSVLPRVAAPGAFLLSALSAPVPLWVPVPLLGGLGLLLYRVWRTDPGDDMRLTTDGRLLSAVVDQLRDAEHEVYFCYPNKKWAFTLVPSLYASRQRGVEVTVVVDRADPHNRYALLAMMGCRVVVTTRNVAAPFRGFLADPESTHHGVMLALSIKPDLGSLAQAYYAPHDHYAIAAMKCLVENLACSDSAKLLADNGHVPALQEAEEGELLRLMARVPAYRSSSINFENVRLADVRPRTEVIQHAKVQQAHMLVRLFETRNWGLFRPCGLLLANGKVTHLVPPVLEETGDTYAIAEGHSRIQALRELGHERVHAVVVRGVSTPPQAPTVRWSKTRVDFDRPDPAGPEVGGKARFARHIETHTHEGVWPLINWSEISLTLEPEAE